MQRLAFLAVLLTSSVALAHPPPEPEYEESGGWRGRPALLEWSTWFRLGWGVTSARDTVIARTVGSPVEHQHYGRTWQTGLGIEGSVPIAKSTTRLGAWAELRGTELFGGGEVLVTGSPKHFDLFFYDGEGILALRAGGSRDNATAAVAWGYRCPWKLFGDHDRGTRYEIGVRVVLTATRAYRDPAEWSTTVGLEVEPVGAIRYLLGIKSWY